MPCDLHCILLRCSGNVSNLFTSSERRFIRALFIRESTLNFKNLNFYIQFVVILLVISVASSHSTHVDKSAYNVSLQSIYYNTFNKQLPKPVLDNLNLSINQTSSLSKEMKFITKLKHRYKRNNIVKVQNESLERSLELDSGKKVMNGTHSNTDSTPVVLLITSVEGLIRTTVDGDEVLLTDHSYCGALDYLYNTDESLLFWSDVYEDKIYSGSFNGSSLTNVKPIVEGNVESVEGIAVDWIRWHIYWVESHYQHIELASFDGSFRTSLISDLIRPRAIALDPEISFLFWTDWEKEKPRIERSDLSGQNRRVLVSINNIERGSWPNGLTLDRILQVVYWVDGKYGILHSVRYDGSNYHIVYKNELSRHPMSLALFGNYIYWTDKKDHTVTQINRWSRKEMKTLLLKEHSIYDIKVFHSSLQPGMSDPCQLGNNGCSHICTLNSVKKPTCVCPYGLLLSSDKKTCKKPAYLLVYFCTQSNGTKNILGIKDLNISSKKWLFPPISLGNNQVIPKSRIAIHPVTNTIFWAEGKYLWKQEFNGEAKKILHLAQRQIISLTVHSPSQNLYLSSVRDDKDDNDHYFISVCSLDGEFLTDIVAKDLCRVLVLKTDDHNVKLLWLHVCRKSGGAKDLYILESSLLDGSHREVLFQSEEKLLEDLSLTQENTKSCLIFASNMSVVCSLSNVTWMIEANLSISTKTPITSFALKGDHVFVTSNSNVYDLWLSKTMASVPWPVLSVDVISTSKEKNVCQESNCSGLCIPISKTKIQCNEIPIIGVKSFLILDEQGSLRGVPLNDNNLSELSSPSTVFPVYLFTPQEDTKVDIWWHTNTIYWSNNTAGGLFSVHLDGSNRRRVATVKGNITSLGIDWISGNLYYGRKNPTGAVLEVLCSHSDVSPYTVINEDLENLLSICVHPLKGYLFWTDVYDGSKIERSLLSGKQRITIISKNYKISNIAVDVVENVFYWCDPVIRAIIRSNLEGLKQEVVLESGKYFPLSVAVSSIYLFWTSRHKDEERIFKSFKNGLGDEVEVFNNTDIKLLHVFDREQQNGSNICSYRNGGCQHLCFYEGDDHHRCACVYSKLGPDGKSCEDYTQFILVTNGNTIESLSLEDITNPNPPVPLIQPFIEKLELATLAYDHAREMIYFAETKQGKGIFQVKQDGSGLKSLVHGGLLHIQGLAYDSKHGILYFTKSIDPSICQFIIDAGVPSKCIIHLGFNDVPHGIAVDSCGHSIYWSNWKETGSLIESFSVNGSIRHSVITFNLHHPTDISLDEEASMLYWVDVHLDETYHIERSSTQGLRRQIIEKGYGHSPFSITVFGDYIFWTMDHQILRSDKNSGDNKIVLRSGVTKPMGLAVVSSMYPECTVATLSNTLQNLDNNCNDTKCWKDLQNMSNSTIADTVELTTLYLVLVILGVLCFLVLLTLFLYYRKRKKYFEESSSGFENQLSNCSQENSVCSETLGEDNSMNSLLSEKDLTYMYLRFTKCSGKSQLLLQNNKEFISDTIL
ncbi:low-density lipoprotein receptor-related protein 1-like isoform X2 [Tachypleus tridentatus]|uniref:low-density lipoprotein receptor-related protein 1-like isoform X2 n=1 Tax=Tachypleus tridentatus TaxID=6853 RepID=UPI003FD48FCD